MWPRDGAYGEAHRARTYTGLRYARAFATGCLGQIQARDMGRFRRALVVMRQQSIAADGTDPELRESKGRAPVRWAPQTASTLDL